MSEQARFGKVTTVTFANANSARMAKAVGRGHAKDLLGRLGFDSPRPVLWVVGAANSLNPDVLPRLQELLDDAVVPTVIGIGGMLVDGGTQAGVMEAVGMAVANEGKALPVLGVAPAGQVTFPGDPNPPAEAVPLDPNHTHFVLAASDHWGGETRLMLDLVGELSRGQPAAVLVVGGGKVARDEVLRAVRSELPVVVLRGTGGFADELADAAEAARRRRPSTNADLREIVTKGTIHPVSLSGDPASLRRVLIGLLAEEPLRMAWQEFARLDQGAKVSQKRFKLQHALILGLGVVATALALVQGFLEQPNSLDRWDWLSARLHYVIVIVPIVIAALIAAAGRFQLGTRYVLLRGSAESIKREIYRYRTRTDAYSKEQTNAKAPGQRLVETVGQTVATLMKTDLNRTSVPAYVGTLPPPFGAAADDDGFSRLSPHQYVELRIDDQLAYYERASAKHERLLRRLRLLVIGFGAIGTFLAAIGLELWIALTASLTGAFTAYLEARQVETSLVLYNQAAADLRAIRGWWMSLAPIAQADENIENLVRSAERILQAEMTGWVQEMQDALAQLRKDEVAAATAAARRERDRSAGVTEEPGADAKTRPLSAGAPSKDVKEPAGSPKPGS